MLSPMQAMCVLSGSILGLLGTTRYFSTKWERISLIFMVTVLRVAISYWSELQDLPAILLRPASAFCSLDTGRQDAVMDFDHTINRQENQLHPLQK
jgi:hypothetical protein